MSIIIIFYFILCLSGVKFAGRNSFFDDYMCKNKTMAINGIFTILVILRHIDDYISFSGQYDAWYNLVNDNIVHQLIVTSFLFYSGYGVMEQIKAKGDAYVKSIPLNRILKLLFHFDLVIVMFIIINIILGIHFPIFETLLAFTAWTKIGNSNWYIFSIICAYTFTWLAFSIFKKNHFVASTATSILLIIYIFIISQLKWWTWGNTLLCYSLGIWYSFLHVYIEKIFSNKKIGSFLYSGAIVFFISLFCFSYERISYKIWWYNIWAISFCGIFVLLSMKIQIYNNMLAFLGSHVFSIYILQRIPMLLLSSLFDFSGHRYMFFFLVVSCTLLFAVAFDTITDFLDTKIFKSFIVKKTI